MKNLFWSAITLMLTTLIIAAVPTDAEARIYEDTLRLHILANSDSESDQRLKLEIRDELLKKYGELLSSAESIDDASGIAEEKLREIERDCQTWISLRGYDYSVKASVSCEWYDTREYDGFTLPCGYYTSLRVIIGEGAGQNWWCVMYPPLCMGMATEAAPADDAVIDYTGEELHLIRSGKYNVKFKVLELLSGVFSKNG